MRSSQTQSLCSSNPKIAVIDLPLPLTELGWHARTSLSANVQRIIWPHQTPCRRLAGKTLSPWFPRIHCCCRFRRLTGVWPFVIYCFSKWRYFVSVSVIETHLRNLCFFYFLMIEMNHYSHEVTAQRGNWVHFHLLIRDHWDQPLPKFFFSSLSQWVTLATHNYYSGLLLCFYLINFCPKLN